ncbi:MAG: sugar phosphate isomerase/epimerase family protein [Armatimonadota bacterium]
MKFGMIHYNAPGNTLEEFLDYAAETGFQYLELGRRDAWAQGDDHPERRAEEVRRALDKRRLAVSALQAGNDFIVLKEDGLAGEVARMRRVAQLATILGTDLLRIDAGWPRHQKPEGEWLSAIVEAIRSCLEFAEAMDIRFALDNHGITTNKAEFQLEVLAQVNSPRLGLNLDTMNYRWFGHDLETIDRYYEMVAPHVFHVHLKDGRGSREAYVGTALGEGEIRLEHAVDSLRRAGYQGAWCAEYEGPRVDSADGYRRCLTWMRDHIGS